MCQRGTMMATGPGTSDVGCRAVRLGRCCTSDVGCGAVRLGRCCRVLRRSWCLPCACAYKLVLVWSEFPLAWGGDGGMWCWGLLARAMPSMRMVDGWVGCCVNTGQASPE